MSDKASDNQLAALPSELIAHFQWTERTGLKELFTALNDEGGDRLRFVGGCVRDSLLGLEPKDVDLATTLPPQEVIDCLNASGIRTEPTGIDHGTVTAIHKGDVAEITTLRADVSTDGRRADVQFSTDWSDDALRRDFTINALYLTPDLLLYDAVAGMTDLRAGRVRFIGNPATRIREDYLRILRFFRFSARFAQEAFDLDGLTACASEKNGISILSAERIGSELARILEGPRSALALTSMGTTGVLDKIWSAPADVETILALTGDGQRIDFPVALAGLWPGDQTGLADRLRLSRAQENRRSAADKARDLVRQLADESKAEVLLYQIGKQAFQDGALLSEAQKWCSWAEAKEVPVFALKGQDVLDGGGAPGPMVSAVLKEVEAAWIAEGFPSPHRQHALLKQVMDGKKK
ncbi:MAG: CCA tRNA nucleotidyltransferase [Pseudomonadota bacterium]